MIGGYNFYKDPYNLATQGERQPGSSFKVFDLAVALEDGFKAVDEGALLAVRTHAGAVRHVRGAQRRGRLLQREDPALARARGLRQQRLLARRSRRRAAEHRQAREQVRDHHDRLLQPLDGDRRPEHRRDRRSTWPTPTRRSPRTARYERVARIRPARADGPRPTTGRRTRRSGPAPDGSCPGPVGDHRSAPANDEARHPQPAAAVAVYPATYAEGREVDDAGRPRDPGTAASAAIPGVAAWGKTGTTNNYADAWFVGSIPKVGRVPSMTVAVWVGYPTSDRSMAHDLPRPPRLRRHLPGRDLARLHPPAMSYYEHPPGHHRAQGRATRSTSTTDGLERKLDDDAGDRHDHDGEPTGGDHGRRRRRRQRERRQRQRGRERPRGAARRRRSRAAAAARSRRQTPGSQNHHARHDHARNHHARHHHARDDHRDQTRAPAAAAP